MKKFLLLLFCCVLPLSAKIIVAAASSMQNALKESASVFTKETGTAVEAVYGSSGKLTAQIKNGAPFDVFMSADMAFPESLAVAKLTEGKPAVYARGTLVLWTIKNIDVSNCRQALMDSAYAKIAVADPLTAPYGKATIAFLRNENIFNAIEKKLVYGDNVSQTAQYIMSGAVDMGITAKSLTKTPEAAGKGHWVELQCAKYPPVDHGIALLRYGMENNPEAAKAFIRFILSDTGRKLLEKCGFTGVN